MAFPEVGVLAGGTQTDAAVTDDTGRPLLVPRTRFKKEGDDDCNDVNLHSASFMCWWTVGRQGAAATDAYAPTDGTSKQPCT